jgi:hypothetical protein
VIGRCPVHPVGAGRNTAEYVTPPHNDADLNAQFNNRLDFSGYIFNHIGTDTEALISHQGFTAQFKGNAFIKGLFQMFTAGVLSINCGFYMTAYIKVKINECQMSNEGFQSILILMTERSDILHLSLFILQSSFLSLSGLETNKTSDGDVLAYFSN